MKDSSSKTDLSSSSSCEGDAIKVFLRVRPPEIANNALPFTGRAVEVNSGGNSVTLLAKPDSKMFTFDHVADVDSTQESVFSAVGKTLIESCVAGYNGTIFAYGQTGSGKTFTMLGPSEDCDSFKHEQRGVIPRSFEHLFNLISREHELHGERKQFLCKCTFLEIYQEQVYDLLDPAASNLHLREDIKKGVFVDGLMEQVVASPTEAYEALSVGWLNRRVAATSMNRESSRSHAVFTLCIESKEEKQGVKNVRQSQLNLVDLAGSERQKDTNTVGIRLKEAGKINQSLSVLGNVIMSLVKIAQGRSQHIPYRDSKLTFLLRDSLGGNARTSIVACVHPDARCFGETLSTLNFAKRAKQIKNKAVINEDTQGNVAHLQTEIRRLREMLSQYQNGISAEHGLGDIGNTPEGSDVTKSSQDSNAAQWKRKFCEAMLFRAQIEQEKEALHQQMKEHAQGMQKKDRIIQSSRLIIKLRESTITNLEKKMKTADPASVPSFVDDKIQEDVASVKTMLDQYPQLAQLDQQLYALRAQLADAHIRLSNTTSLLDSNRLSQLDQAFQELQAANRRESLVCISPQPGENRSTASLQKLKEKLASLEEENSLLKKQGIEDRQSWGSREASLQAELTATQTMNAELKRLLEANHLKHRIQSDALTSLHCQTIKALTPTRNSYDLRNRAVPKETGKETSPLALDRSMEMEKGDDDILLQAPPENTHEVLTEEIHSLQQNNNSLQERINEYEAAMVQTRQQITQLELEKKGINEMLTKERGERGSLQEEQERSLRDLTDTVESLTLDLKYAQDEVKDYRILLQSSDKELQAEKDKVKSKTSNFDQKINSLETQLLQVQCLVETLGRQLEEESKEREVIEEKLDMERMEKMFVDEQLQAMQSVLQAKEEAVKTCLAKIQEMEKCLAAEKEEQHRLQERSQQYGKQQEEQLAEVTQLKQMLADVNRDCEEKRSQLDAMATELQTAKVTVSELTREASDNKEALQQQVQRVQELRSSLQEWQERCSQLQDTVSRKSAEADDARQQAETLTTQLDAKCTEVDAAAVQNDMLNEDLAFYQEQNEKNAQECVSMRQNIESLEEEKEALQKEMQSLREELEERDRRLQTITLHLEESRSQQMHSPLSSPQKLLEHNTVHENKLDSLVEELTSGRKLWLEENQQLKNDLVALRLDLAQKVDIAKKCEDLQRQLNTQHAVFKETSRHMKEEYDAERSETQLLKESLAEAQLQQDKILREKQLLLTQCDEAQAERVHAEEETERLKAVVEKCYAEKDQLHSLTEELREDYKRTKEELLESAQKLQELAEFNAILAGHANHQQKVMYVKRLQTDYNKLNEKYEEVVRDNHMLRSRVPSSPLRDRTNAPPSVSQTEPEKHLHV